MLRIDSKEFYEALIGSESLKKSPSGGRSCISKITEIRPFSINQIEIIAPFKRSILNINGKLDKSIFVNAKVIEKASIALIKSKTITLTINKNLLTLLGLCRISIPTE